MELPSAMKAMVLETPMHSLILRTLPLPTPTSQQVLIKVLACGICRTQSARCYYTLNHLKYFATHMKFLMPVNKR